MSELYVYYKLRRDQAEPAHDAFAKACAGAPVRLLQRVDSEHADVVTWMEIHGADVHDPLTVERRLADALAPFIEGPRHVEIFEPFSR